MSCPGNTHADERAKPINAAPYVLSFVIPSNDVMEDAEEWKQEGGDDIPGPGVGVTRSVVPLERTSGAERAKDPA